MTRPINKSAILERIMPTNDTKKTVKKTTDKTKKVVLTPDNLVQSIMSDINKGVYGNGEWLKQIDLEKRYKCSRIKVREALSYLHSKRLVEHIANYGYRVPSPDPERIKEVAEIRILLECQAAIGMIDNATALDIEQLYSLAMAFKDAAYSGTSFMQIDTNIAFHKHIYSLCPNQSLRELIQDMRLRGPAAPVDQWQTIAKLEQATNDHLAMVDAIKAKDLVKLQSVLRDHIGRKIFEL